MASKKLTVIIKFESREGALAAGWAFAMWVKFEPLMRQVDRDGALKQLGERAAQAEFVPTHKQLLKAIIGLDILLSKVTETEPHTLEESNELATEMLTLHEDVEIQELKP